MGSLEAKLQAENRRLREEREELQERIRQLEEVLRPDVSLPMSWRLTIGESAIIAALLQREWLPLEALLEACRNDHSVECTDIVRVHIFRIRRKLKKHGVVISTVWGKGYALEDRQSWRSRLLAGPIGESPAMERAA